MKARVKATGEIVEVMYSHTAQDKGYATIWYITPRGASFFKEELEFIDTGESLDYWTRLEHTYAGMAMQGILGSEEIMKRINTMPIKEDQFGLVIAELSVNIAHALVEKYKKEE